MTSPTSRTSLRDLLLWGLYRRIRPAIWRVRTMPRLAALTDTSFRRLAGLPENEEDLLPFLDENLRHRLYFHSRNRKEFFLSILTSLQQYEGIIDEADDVLENVYDVLGSGTVRLGESIDWHRDFKSGTAWPVLTPSRLDLLQEGSPSDVKVPWELSRFHQVWWLGKAYWLTGSERYPERFRQLVEDWLEKNPAGQGVNWAMPMEAGIRACNWIVGYSFFSGSGFLPSVFWTRFLRALYEHGVFIEHHLEYALPRGNHFLSNVTALIHLGVMFHWTSFGRRWFTWGVRQLEIEMGRQVYADGVSYEKSTQYQRLILELFYTPVILGQRSGHAFSPEFMERLHRMFRFIAAVQRTDGTVPQFGDADDGRLFRIRRREDPNDVRHAVSIGALLFDDPFLKHAAGGFRQDSLWLLGAEAFEKERLVEAQAPSAVSYAFPDGGYYVLRSQQIHIVVDAGDIGMEGKGGHGHNDTTSFEYWSDGDSVIVDPGTYVYTADVRARDEFRSVQAHNTLMVDGRDPVRFAGIFRIESDHTNPHVDQWSTSGERDTLVVSHEGYIDLRDPVVHTRTFDLDKLSGSLAITDEVRGSADHRLLLSLHLHPDVRVESHNNKAYILRRNGHAYRVSFSEERSSVDEGWFSPSYGVKRQAKVLRLRLHVPLPYTIQTIIERIPG